MICVLRGEFYKVFTGNSFYGRATIENSKGPTPKKLVPLPIPIEHFRPLLYYYHHNNIIIIIIIMKDIDIIVTLGLYYQQRSFQPTPYIEKKKEGKRKKDGCLIRLKINNILQLHPHPQFPIKHPTTLFLPSFLIPAAPPPPA